MRWPLRAYQKSGLQTLLRGTGALKLLPKKIQAMEALLPNLSSSDAVAEVTPAQGQKRLLVGLLLGCVQREFFPQVNVATARVLAAEGCEVIAPQEQPCCGALLVHAGEDEAALALARRPPEAVDRPDVDIIVTNAAGRGSSQKESDHHPRAAAQQPPRAAESAAKAINSDITLVTT